MRNSAIQATTVDESTAATPSRAKDFFELTKPRLNFLVLTTTFVGYFAANVGAFDMVGLFHAMFGTALVAGGASALNMYIERERDSRMKRTANRPLPTGRLAPIQALLFGSTLGLIGCLYLWVLVNPLTSIMGFISFATYVWFYTPLKVRSTFNTLMGAISGALPPVMGWTAVRGTLDIEAAALFGILFLWQHPHFFALSWMYRKDYEVGGYRMLPVIDPDGSLSGRLMILFNLALVPVSLILTLRGLTGHIYAFGAVSLALWSVWVSVRFMRTRTNVDAKKVFKASLIYLPALLLLIMIDKQI